MASALEYMGLSLKDGTYTWVENTFSEELRLKRSALCEGEI